MNKLGFRNRTKHIKKFFIEAFDNRMKYEGLDYWRHVYYILSAPILIWYYMKYKKEEVIDETRDWMS